MNARLSIKTLVVAAICSLAAHVCCTATWAQSADAAGGQRAGFATLGVGLHNRPVTTFDFHGDFRTRGEGLYNLDLDRGTTPSGQLLFPVPLADPRGQWLSGADMRLRTDLSAYAPGGQIAVRMRLDILDNLALGSAPAGPPAATMGQLPAAAPIRLKRVWAEALVPFGVLSAGRMGSHWGLGMLTHSGDCEDCNSGDAADRIALVSPLFGHIVALSYDFSAVGAQGSRIDGARAVDLDPSDDVRTVTAAVMRWHGDETLARRGKAGLSTFDWGLYGTYRWQDNDFQSVGSPAPTQAIQRGLSAAAADAWLRWIGPKLRIEAEFVGVSATIAQPTLLPGVLYRADVQSQQFGGALQSEWGDPAAGFGFGLDAGVASGDPAPGVAPPSAGLQPIGKAGDLFGGQLNVPGDRRADDFHFHTDFRVDRILFHELLGTVTDAAYARPHIRWRHPRFGAGRLDLDLAAVASTALYATSTPSGSRPLGFEVDPTISYRSRDGFGIVLGAGVLVPFSGLDNPARNLPARLAGVVQLRMHYVF